MALIDNENPHAYTPGERQAYPLGGLSDPQNKKLVEQYRERSKILEEREKTHGNFATVSRTAQKIKSAIREATVFPVEQKQIKWSDIQREAVDMIATKLARISQNPYEKDHWIDIKGYVDLALEELES